MAIALQVRERGRSLRTSLDSQSKLELDQQLENSKHCRGDFERGSIILTWPCFRINAWHDLRIQVLGVHLSQSAEARSRMGAHEASTAAEGGSTSCGADGGYAPAGSMRMLSKDTALSPLWSAWPKCSRMFVTPRCTSENA